VAQARDVHGAPLGDQRPPVGVGARQLIPEWGAMNAPILGEELSAALTGQKSIEDALENASKRIYELLDRAGYYTW